MDILEEHTHFSHLKGYPGDRAWLFFGRALLEIDRDIPQEELEIADVVCDGRMHCGGPAAVVSMCDPFAMLLHQTLNVSMKITRYPHDSYEEPLSAESRTGWNECCSSHFAKKSIISRQGFPYDKFIEHPSLTLVLNNGTLV